MGLPTAMRAALHALSYTQNIELDKTYKLHRAVESLTSPLNTIYHLWDHEVLSGGRRIRVRIYTPHKQTDDRLLLFFHGGGWVLESVDTYNNVCQNLARKTGCRVASVEYALAPEHVFPDAVEDCYAVAQAIHLQPEQFGVTKQEITLIGDSAGGNLAAAVSLMARDRGVFSIARQILIYPATYNNHSESSCFASVRENGTDYLLTSKRVREFMTAYAGRDPRTLNNPYFAPLLAKDLSNQPETLVITAEFDPLRDEGEAYAAALKRAGNSVRQIRMKNGLHGYFSLPLIFPLVRQTYDEIYLFLNGEQE